ncbi:unnamed protein product [Phytophthora fragariaefolia]|uniref:Unnamed protein product n=1 Tax=Phytophthora fragariaefolia TaxID=1490495 RepID=A0A9W6YDF1_9STRA|nr:unnamed protein product [Phytophthora fragariaefolia]
MWKLCHWISQTTTRHLAQRGWWLIRSPPALDAAHCHRTCRINGQCGRAGCDMDDDEFIVGSDLPVMLGINVDKQLEQLAGRGDDETS